MRRLLTAAAVTAILGAAATSSAAPFVPGVIYATDTYVSGISPVTIDPNEGTRAATCAGDPSYTTPRLFVTVRDNAVVWSDASCVSADLFRDPELTVSYARWSPRETHVAFVAGPLTDPASFERSVYVASVSRADGGDLALATVTRIYDLPYGGTAFKWTPDGAWLVFAHPNPAHKTSPSDADAIAPNDIYSLSIDGAVLVNLTNTPASEYDPVVSPDGQRLAFVRQTVTRGVARSDVFTMPASGGTSVQLTNKSNTNAFNRNSQPVWSPDGAHVAFACLPNSSSSGTHVCRIDSQGRTKATDLTPRTTASFSMTAWRAS